MPYVFRDHGSIRETFRSDTAVDFEWRIPEFLQVLDEDGDSYTCPRVKFLGAEWSIIIYPNGEPGPQSKTKGHIAIAMLKYQLEPRIPVLFTLGIKSIGAPKDVTLRNQRYPHDSHASSLLKLASKPYLLRHKSQLVPSGTLTVTCTIKREELSSSEGSSDESTDGSESGIGRGVTQVADEQLSLPGRGVTQVADEQLSLPGRGVTEVADEQLSLPSGGVTEVVDEEIDRERHQDEGSSDESTDSPEYGIDWAAFRKFFKDNAKIPDNLSTDKVMGLYSAGDQHDFPELKEMCVEFLEFSLSIHDICDVISFARRHGEGELLELATSFFTRNANEVIKTQEFRHFVRSNPHEAHELFVKGVEATCVQKR